MITDNDIKKLKGVFATKEDLDESEARTAFGFSDVQSQISDLKVQISDVKEGQMDLTEKVDDLTGEVREIRQQMHGMEQNIISAIRELKDDHEVTKKRVSKLERVTLSN